MTERNKNYKMIEYNIVWEGHVNLSNHNNSSSAQSYIAIGGVIVLLVINAFVAVYFGNPFGSGATIDMDNLAKYTVSQTNTMYDEIPTDVTSKSDTSLPVTSPSDGKLLYPDPPYFIEIDKTNQVVTVFTTSSSGRYDKPVRIMLCSTSQNPDKFPNGYWLLKEDRTTSKNVWRQMQSHGAPLYAQYTTQITGHFLFHSVPYTDKKKEALDQQRFAKLGTADSGGCVRLTVENAKWISENCKPGTYVHMTEKTKNPALTKALKEQVPKPDSSGWDPTDPDPKNPNYHPQYTEDMPQPEGYLVDNRGLDKIKISQDIWDPNKYVS